MRNNPTIVQKYGGVCLETPEKIRAVARSLADLHSRGHRVVAIVSAMGKTTDELIKAAYQVSPHPNRRELDMLLTTGERISMSLMSMALSDLGAPAISFTGSQAGVMTDESHSFARILDVRPARVLEELGRGRIVVLAGFQGVNPRTKEITTLGRGGSDTTAVAMAAALKAERCEIIKEVTEFARPIRASWRTQSQCAGWILHPYPKCVFGAPRFCIFAAWSWHKAKTSLCICENGAIPNTARE